MADRLALVIAVESYLDPAVPPAAHAEADALAFARALQGLGFARDHQIVLTGSQATRTAVESRLRKITRNPPAAESLFVFWAGHAFSEDDQPYLACYDTQADDLAATAVPVPALLSALAGPSRRALFVDPRAGLAAPPMPTGELEKFFADQPTAVCLLSCAEGEKSHTSGSLKAGVWAHHVT